MKTNITGVALAASLLGCSGGGSTGETPAGNTTPQLGQDRVSSVEYDSSSTPITNFCKNSTQIIIDLNNTVPATNDYSIQNGNLKIDLTNTDVPDGNQVRTIPVSCINGTEQIDGNITVTETDIANDVAYVLTSSNLPTLIADGDDYNATLKGTDSDGIPTVEYNVLDGNDDNSTLRTGFMTCNADAGNQDNSTCTTAISGLAINNNLHFTYNIQPETAGKEHVQSDINGTKNFEVKDQNTAPTIDTSNMTINGSDSSDYNVNSDTINSIIDLVANDPDGIGSYTITSALFGEIISGNGDIPNNFNYNAEAGSYGETDTITISVTDNNANPLTTETTVNIRIH